MIDYLRRVVDVAAEVDGWMSASLRKGHDGRRVVIMRKAPVSTPRPGSSSDAEGLVFGNKQFAAADPGFYEVVFMRKR